VTRSGQVAGVGVPSVLLIVIVDTTWLVYAVIRCSSVNNLRSTVCRTWNTR